MEHEVSEVALPRDHEGREVSLETDSLFDVNGRELRITSYSYRHTVFGHCSQWKAFSPDVREDEGMLPVNALYLTPPDSLERLADDLDRAFINHSNGLICAYNKRDRLDCDGCKFNGNGPSCGWALIKDITKRVHRLGGEKE